MINYCPIVGPGDVIAVGDIHARFDLLEELLNHLRASQATVVLLGDIIDRGGDDVRVLNKVKQLLEDPESEGLSNFFMVMGNHEAMFVDAMIGSGEQWSLWLQNGGNFEQYGEMQDHLEWIVELPVYITIGDTMFIHAGIAPGKNPIDTINAGGTDQLLWMRQPFLTYGPEFQKWSSNLKQVVFGHTPKFEGPEKGKPYEIPGGVCIDSGAYFTDKLTSFNATRNTLWQYDLSNNA